MGTLADDCLAVHDSGLMSWHELHAYVRASSAVFPTSIPPPLSLSICDATSAFPSSNTCSLTVVAQVALAASAWPFNRHICESAALTSTAATAFSHRVFAALSFLGSLAPLPVSAAVRHDSVDECTAVLTFLQLALGTLVSEGSLTQRRWRGQHSARRHIRAQHG